MIRETNLLGDIKMALVSPGVEVTVIDQSQYVTTAAASVPLIVLATAQNKANAAGTGVAIATTKGNANKLYQVTSQRDLVNLFGNPFFYKTSNGTPIQGYELNEYGLLAAYSLLGVTNTAYVLRADVDLATLVGQVSRPSGAPANGTYWLDTTNSLWGIFEFNATNGKFTNKVPFVITDAAQINNGAPVSTLGNIGDYAVVAIEPAETPAAVSEYFYKNKSNVWVPVGSTQWKRSLATVAGSIDPNNSLNPSHEFTINVNGEYTLDIVFGSTSISGVVDAINAFGITNVYAEAVNGKLVIYSSHPAKDAYLTLTDVVAGSLASLGIDEGTFYQPEVTYGTSSQMPLWTASQLKPRPTGSVWIKVGSARDGLTPILTKYNSAAASFVVQTVNQFVSDAAANATLDSTGGAAIPVGTVFAQYQWGGSVNTSPLYFWERAVSGETVVTGSVVDPTFISGSVLKVRVSVPGSSAMSDVYAFQVAGNDSDAFVNSWKARNIPYTSITNNTTSGAIQIVHTAGGVIELDDTVDGISDPVDGIIASAGFTAGTVTGAKNGSIITYQNTTAPVEETGDAIFNVSNLGTHYVVNGITSGGSGYSVGDTLTILGSNLGGVDTTNDLTLVVISVNAGAVESVGIVSGTPAVTYSTALSNWIAVSYTANEGAPMADPATGTPWYYSVVDEVDILVNVNNVWKGYGNVAFDSSGHPAATGVNSTDPNGVIVSASEPSTQSDGVTQLAYGDLWLDSSDLENYPMIYRWQSVDTVDQWVLIDKTDQTSSTGIVFADARWAPNGTTDPIDDPIPAISNLLTSNYLDLDAPDANSYPQGMLLFNTRRSGYNVKTFKTNYFNGLDFEGSLPAVKNAWVSASGTKNDGSPYMGRKAQRNMVVQALKAAITTNMGIREEDTFFNLMASPGYPELQPDMVALNNDRNNTAYIVGDTPLRLSDQASEIQAWARNEAGAASTGEDGLVTRDEYMGIFYPSGIATDLTGASVVVPASHMMLRTFLRNDQVAYPWFAAAGTRRGTIDNATNIGYIEKTTGEFVSIKNRMGIRDVLYTNQLNPLAYFTNVGLLNWGNKNSKDTQSAMDRTNVARLVCYLRERLQVLARPFVFEPNDAITRQEMTGVVQSLLVDLVAKRGVYDYLVVCDESNNTPARIDRNELWVDVAIEPVKAAEFIYIPVRILNTGEIGG
jgi:hypothetical protein